MLKKVIEEIKISSDYRGFVDFFCQALMDEFGDKIHSIYMCGSIPKGSAKPFKSDADFTVLCERREDIDEGQLIRLKEKALEAYPLVTKIDTTICTLQEVTMHPNDWGFWIKIICVNIYGTDIGESIPPICISKDFILDLTSDARAAIRRVDHALMTARDPQLKSMYMKGYAKKLIRGLYTLILEAVGEWQDDLWTMTQLIIRHSDIKPSLVEFLYESYQNTDRPVEAFKAKADEVYAYFDHCLTALSA